MNVGDRVYYREDVVEEIGVIVDHDMDPEELQSYSDEGFGPDHGDVMVKWSDGRTFWEDKRDLEKVDNDDDE